MDKQELLNKQQIIEKKIERDKKNLKVVFWLLVVASVYFIYEAIAAKSAVIIIYIPVIWAIYLIFFGLNKFFAKTINKMKEEVVKK